MNHIDKHTGQSTAEYAVLIAIVIAAAVGMQTYVKRGLQAKYKDASDTLTAAVGTGGISLPELHQYEPYYADSKFEVTQTQDRTETVAATGAGTSGQVTRSGITEVTSRAIAKTDQTTGTETGFQAQSILLDRDDDWPAGNTD